MIGISRFYWDLSRLFVGIKCACAITGIVCNCILLLTTIRTKSLRATFNVLIAICAIGDIFHAAGSLVSLPFVFDFYSEIDSDICLAIMFLPQMGIATGCACALCIGLDRMLSILMPIRHRLIDRRFYHLGFIFVKVGCCAFLCYLMFTFYRRRKVLCGIGSPYPDNGIYYFLNAVLVINIASAFLYFTVWLCLRFQAESTVTHRIIKSLMIIVSVDVCGWIMTPGLYQIFNYLKFDNQQMFVGKNFSEIFVILALSLKLLIYYSTSTEYRDAVNKLFFKKQFKINKIHAIGTM